MKTLFIGGIKSGKSVLAERFIIERSGAEKPYYLATNEFFDADMQARVDIHQQRRQQSFITLEEPTNLVEVLQSCQGSVLIECISMWLNNLLHRQIPEADILQSLTTLMQLPHTLVLVHNEVGLGVIPDNELARKFIDLSGKAAQLMAQHCDEVFFCSAGLSLQMK